MPGPAWELPRQRTSQRCWPEPFVEVAEHHRGHRVWTRDRHQSACLTPSLVEGQPEMRSDQSEHTRGRCNFDLDRATRLALRMGDVMNVRGPQRPTTQHQLSVLPIRRNDRFCFHPVLAHGLAQHGECGLCRCDGSSRIDLLQRHDVGMMMYDGINDASQIEEAVGAYPAVDVPSHHPDGTVFVQFPPPRHRRTNACAPIDTASQVSTASRKSTTFVGVGSATMLQI
jgi:hypothetical protein